MKYIILLIIVLGVVSCDDTPGKLENPNLLSVELTQNINMGDTCLVSFGTDRVYIKCNEDIYEGIITSESDIVYTSLGGIFVLIIGFLLIGILIKWSFE